MVAELSNTRRSCPTSSQERIEGEVSEGLVRLYLAQVGGSARRVTDGSWVFQILKTDSFWKLKTITVSMVLFPFHIPGEMPGDHLCIWGICCIETEAP